MRECPEYILRMVREMDRALDVRWDGDDACWYLWHRGERLFSLDHGDGTPIRNLDGCGAELLETLRRCDVRRAGRREFRRRAAGLARQRRDGAERERVRLQEETTGSAREVARWLKQGHTPRSGGVFEGVKR